MRAGQGDSRLPAWDGEAFGHYLWRLAKFLGRDAGAEPELNADRKRGGPEKLFPERQPGEDDAA